MSRLHDDYEPPEDGPPTRDLKPLRDKIAEPVPASQPPRPPGSLSEMEVERYLDIPLPPREPST